MSADPLRGLRILSIAIGGMSTALPGYAYFTDYAPPLFPASALITGGLGIVALWHAYHTAKARRRGLLRKALVRVVLSLALMTAYFIAYREWTVGPPPQRAEEGGRWQVGFGLASWSLTDRGRDYVEQARATPELSAETPQDLMMAFEAYGNPSMVRVAWVWWAVYVAGVILIALFVGAFLLWANTFGILSKHASVVQRRTAVDRVRKKAQVPASDPAKTRKAT